MADRRLTVPDQKSNKAYGSDETISGDVKRLDHYKRNEHDSKFHNDIDLYKIPMPHFVSSYA